MPSPASDHAAHQPNLERLLQVVRADFDLARLKLPAEYRYASLPLCVIDAVFSIGVTYAGTQNTVRRWCETGSPPWAMFQGDTGAVPTISEFLAEAGATDPEALATQRFGNRQRTSSRSGLLKADAVLRFARVLQDHGVERLGDTEGPEVDAVLRPDIATIPGQGSGISLDYFLMLAGSDHYVKADRMICRYIGRALGEPAVTAPRARDLLGRAARALQIEYSTLTPRLLDYALWDRERSTAVAVA